MGARLNATRGIHLALLSGMLALASGNLRGATARAFLSATVDCPFFAWGDVRVERNATSQSLTVRGDVPAGLYDVFLQDAVESADFTRIGGLDHETVTNGQRLLTLALSRNGGCPEPLQEPDIAFVAGRLMEVRIASGPACLRGAVPPPLPLRREPKGVLVGRMDLQRPVVHATGKAAGAFSWQHDGVNGSLRVVAQRLHKAPMYAAAVPLFRLQIAVTEADGFLTVGHLAFYDALVADSSWDFSRQQSWLLELPLGAGGDPRGLLGTLFPAQLVGRPLQVVDAAGLVVLTTEIPAAGLGKPASTKLRCGLSPAATPAAAGPSGRVSAAWDPRRGRSRFDLTAKGLPPATVCSLWIEDPVGSNAQTWAAELPHDGGNTKFRRDTSRGDPLPLGLVSAVDLAGRRLDVRDAEGRVLLHGILPWPHTAAP